MGSIILIAVGFIYFKYYRKIFGNVALHAKHISGPYGGNFPKK